MQRDGKRKWFVMEPPAVPDAANAPTEQTPTFDVYAVLRDHMRYVALIHTELRQARHDKQEMEMKVSELTSKVDELITVATDLKGRVDAGGSNSTPGSPVISAPAEDDPEVERLAHRIEDAIAVLKGDKHADQPQSGSSNPSSGVTPIPGNQFDPNSPAPEQPSDAALATDINSSQARDPNSPL